MLTSRRYFLASLALPLVAPLVAASLVFVTASELAAGFAAIFLFSLLIGGVPYLIFVAGVLLWSRGRSDSAIRKLSFIAPLLFVLVTAAISPVALLFGLPLREIPVFIAAFAFYALIFGYLYVFIVNSVYEVFLARHPET